MPVKMSKQPKQLIPNGMVEIRGDNGAYYNAFVVDIDDNTDSALVTVSFVNDWQPKQKFPLDRIRLPPADGSAADANGTAGDQRELELVECMAVEVLSKTNENEDCGYFRASIQMIKDDYIVVVYDPMPESNAFRFGLTANKITNFTEIVTRERIRKRNPNRNLTTNPFFKIVMDVPKEMASKTLPLMVANETHQQLKKSINAVVVRFDESSCQLVCIGYADREKDYHRSTAEKRALMLSEMHFRNILQKVELMEKNESIRDHFKSLMGDNVRKTKDEYELTVSVSTDYIGLAIGTNGANMKQILALDGIIAVDNNKGVFRVRGKTRDACLRARDMLQYMEVVVEVPRQLVGHAIGKNGRYIQEIINKAGIINVTVKGDKKGDELKPFVLFVFLGTRQAIENAKILLRYHLNSIMEMERNNRVIEIEDISPTKSVVK